METIAFVSAIVLGIVFVAERLAFAVLLYLLTAWLMKACHPVMAMLVAHFLIVRGWLRLRLFALRHWWAMRALRSQLIGGATP